MASTMIAVRAIVQCNECGGTGIREHAPYCRDCLQTISHHAIMNLSNDGLMPCGHPWERLEEQEPCGECDGTGEVEIWLSFKQFCAALVEEIGKEQRWPGQIPP